MARNRYSVACITILLAGCGDAAIDSKSLKPPKAEITSINIVTSEVEEKGTRDNKSIKVEGTVRSGEGEWRPTIVLVKILDTKDENLSYSSKGLDQNAVGDGSDVQFAFDFPCPKGVSKVLARVIVFGDSAGDGDGRKLTVDQVKEIE